MLPQITGEFRVVADPDLRFAPSGVAVTTMRVVANSRKKVGDEWVDDKVVWLKVIAFKKMAENIAESLTKGALCIVSGRLETQEWEVKEGENAGQKRQDYIIIADSVGPSVAYKPAKIMDVERSGQQQASQPSAPAQDPWGTPSAQSDEPPF